ncbi:hypothetical protein [Streptomyces eurythermus]|uniref:hypothetical protein n=1 Tax=Streptomyces eurythermus TaxID=42237 RepID=UPI0033C4F9F4
MTLGGEAVAQIRDTVFDARAGRVTGFTLSGRGLLAGPPQGEPPLLGSARRRAVRRDDPQ